MKTATTTDTPDTPRRHLSALAHRALSFPHTSREDIEDKVALVSIIADEERRDRAFRDLLTALAAGDRDRAETVLDLMTGSQP